MKEVFLGYEGDCISADNSRINHHNKTCRAVDGETRGCSHSGSTVLPGELRDHVLIFMTPRGPAGCEYLINIPSSFTGVFVNMIHGLNCCLSRTLQKPFYQPAARGHGSSQPSLCSTGDHLGFSHSPCSIGPTVDIKRLSCFLHHRSGS